MGNEVGKEILRQINALDKRAMTAWGAKNILWTENGMRFTTSGMVKWKGIVSISLNKSDTYDIEFGKVRVLTYQAQKTMKGVSVENLVSSIDSYVG